MDKCVLVIGNKNYSSWSLRAWLALRKSHAHFEERRIPLDTPQFDQEIVDLSPTRRVPVLWHGAVCIWESLAIAEYANEQFARGSLWPQDSGRRAWARAVSAEMHAGFTAIRSSMPMNCRARGRRVPETGALQADIARVQAMWAECRAANGAQGPWLFGEFSIADAMFAPVASRFLTYGVALSGAALAYQQTVLEDADMQQWLSAAEAEAEVVAADEAG